MSCSAESDEPSSCKLPIFCFFFSEGPAFENGTLKNTEPGFPGLRGEQGPKGNQGLKGVKGDFIPQTPWRRFSGE